MRPQNRLGDIADTKLRRMTESCFNPDPTKSTCWKSTTSSNPGSNLSLRADTRGEEVAKRWKFRMQDHRSLLDLAVCLRQRCHNDVTFIHGKKSDSVYSGSPSP